MIVGTLPTIYLPRLLYKAIEIFRERFLFQAGFRVYCPL
jgi:hypothetical protein